MNSADIGHRQPEFTTAAWMFSQPLKSSYPQVRSSIHIRLSVLLYLLLCVAWVTCVCDVWDLKFNSSVTTLWAWQKITRKKERWVWRGKFWTTRKCGSRLSRIAPCWAIATLVDKIGYQWIPTDTTVITAWYRRYWCLNEVSPDSDSQWYVSEWFLSLMWKYHNFLGHKMEHEDAWSETKCI